MNFKYALHPKDYAIGQIEKYYTDMAAKGWHLKKHGLWFSEFVQGEPADMKYRVEVLQPKGDKFEVITMSDEQKAVFEDCGWEYVDGHGYISVLRAPAESDTEEFYLDPAQQADTLKVLRKNMKGNVLYWPVYLVIWLLMHTMMGENMPAQLYLLWLERPQVLLSVLAIVLAFSIDSIVGMYHLNKLYKQMKNGTPLDHSPKKLGRLPAIIKFVTLALSFAILWSPFADKSEAMPLISDGGYVTLSDIGFDVPTGDRSWLHSSGLSHKESIFCDFWKATEDIDKEEFDTLVWLNQDVYKLKNQDKALKTAKALMNTSTFAQSEEKFSEMEFAGLEKVYCNSDLELVVINKGYVGYFTSIFTRETRIRLLTRLAEKWI